MIDVRFKDIHGYERWMDFDLNHYKDITLKDRIYNMYGTKIDDPVVTAIGNSIEFIVKNIGNVPYAHMAKQTIWRGDFAHFIIDNLPRANHR